MITTWMRDSLTDILRTNRHADCKFIIETTEGSKSSSGEVKLNDVEPKVFEKFREYVYGYDDERLEVYDFDTLVKLAEFGNKYLVESIKEDCVRHLLYRKEMFDTEELLRLFQCAHTLDYSLLIDHVSRDLKNHAKRVLNHSAIYQFSTDVFKSYIEVVESRLSEPERFNLIEMYIKYHDLDAPDTAPTDTESDDEKIFIAPAIEGKAKINGEYISELLGLIDFCKFTAKDFYEGPGKSNLLTLQQKYENLYKIARSCSHVSAQEELETKLGNSFLSSSCHSDHEVQLSYISRSSRRGDLLKPDMTYD
ncbi:hypothetical protein AWZ03_014454 [Drosophila navojoa]|uniref:BTB domain-containing protein n=1 Tax=Drosophila navojoa TaxID=7232 RepID=A0A484AU96_DRONA|nr:hypothetical protein AWZ03_014454 [Drosophila navojoa]